MAPISWIMCFLISSKKDGRMVCGTVRFGHQELSPGLVRPRRLGYLQEGRKDKTAMQTTRKDPEWVTLFARSDAHYRVSGMKDVRVRGNLLVSRDLGEPLSFDLYIANSQQPTSLAPVVVLIHGGPISPDWVTRPRQWRAFQSIGELLAASGLSAVIFDHRFHSREETDPAIYDIELVLSHIGANAAELGVDGGRIGLWAFSRGGIFLARYLRDPPTSLRCLVAFYAAL